MVPNGDTHALRVGPLSPENQKSPFLQLLFAERDMGYDVMYYNGSLVGASVVHGLQGVYLLWCSTKFVIHGLSHSWAN